MMYTLEFTEDATKVIKKWKKSNPNLHKKLLKLLHELADSPRVGTLGSDTVRLYTDGSNVAVTRIVVTYNGKVDVGQRMLHGHIHLRIEVVDTDDRCTIQPVGLVSSGHVHRNGGDVNVLIIRIEGIERTAHIR